jgi:hypothetical protein
LLLFAEASVLPPLPLPCETDNEAPNEEPIQNPTKRHRKTAKEWTELVGQRISGRTHKPTLKLSEQPESQSVQAVGRDLDHPTDEQARDGVYKNEWQKARQKEREQLQRYGVYSKVQGIPEGYKAVDTKWVYVIKRNPNGSIEKFKARKVGRGFSQEKGINYDKTYAQMARLETWRIMLTVALSKGWKIRQWDVVAAYLQAKLEHTVYITDLNEEGKIEYWILHKALYGLKQAAHEWSKKLKQILEYAGFQ